MTIQYSPNSSLTITHSIRNRQDFTSIIDTPVIETVRDCTITLQDTTTYTTSMKKRLTNSSLVDSCIQKRSTLLYMDSLKGIYIWKYEEQEVQINFQVGINSYVDTINGVDFCYGIVPLLRTINAEVVPIAGFYYVTNPTEILCKETIYAITPNDVNKQILVSEHTYTKDALANKPPNEGDTSFTAQFDGGIDFYYPLWCRNMLDDPLWRQAAQDRWTQDPHVVGSIYPIPNNISSSKDIEDMLKINTDPQQVGSIVFNTKGKFIESLIFNMHTDENTTHVHNVVDSNVGSLYDLLTAAGYSGATSFYPSGLI